MSTHGGMLGAVTHACEIHELTGCSLEEAFAFQRAMAGPVALRASRCTIARPTADA